MNAKARQCLNPLPLVLLILLLALPGTMMRAGDAPENAARLAARGARLIRACEYEAAEILLDRAIELEPNLWSARFNRARIPLRKRDWREARNRFEAILAAETRNENIQLLEYEILLTRLLAGEDEAVAESIDDLERAAQGPAARYARAARARQQEADEEARHWLAAASLAPDPLTPLYVESLADLGWEPNERAQDSAVLSVSSLP